MADGNGRPTWIDELFDSVQPVIPAGFVGRIELNAFNGRVAKIIVQQAFSAEVHVAR